MKNRRFLRMVLLSICLTGAFARVLSASIATFVEHKHRQPATHTYTPKAWRNSVVKEVKVATDPLDAKCLQRENGICTSCGIDATTNTKVSNKTRTFLLTCRGMKPGPAKLVMATRAEPVSPGLWEVEFGLGYHTSAREECPHQFIASNNPPIKAVYEIGPISIEGEIPPDGIIQAMVCVGLSSARAGGEGKETGAALKISKLGIVSQ
jgi:hypothetical protein